MTFGSRPTMLPTADQALPGRSAEMEVSGDHLVLGNPIKTDPPEGMEVAIFGLGCFWGEEQTFWQIPGVWSTSVGYAGGITPNPSYEEVCTGLTGHAEVVRIIFDPTKVTYRDLLKVFWENHDPTQGMRQGNDRGTQYRSIIVTTSDEQRQQADESRAVYQQKMHQAGFGDITTDITELSNYYYAEQYHQQYLVKNPNGYCPLHATGVTYD